MKTELRRIAILEKIKETKQPISASKLAAMFSVSRQAIVQDVAILKAKKEPVIATPRGYMYQKDHRVRFVTTCMHEPHETEKELQCIVDMGGNIENVIVEHPIYGEIIGQLNIASRYDIAIFIDKCRSYEASNLSVLSNGVHYHTISCDTKEQEKKIIEVLKEKKYLCEN